MAALRYTFRWWNWHRRISRGLKISAWSCRIKRSTSESDSALLIDNVKQMIPLTDFFLTNNSTFRLGKPVHRQHLVQENMLPFCVSALVTEYIYILQVAPLTTHVNKCERTLSWSETHFVLFPSIHSKFVKQHSTAFAIAKHSTTKHISVLINDEHNNVKPLFVGAVCQLHLHACCWFAFTSETVHYINGSTFILLKWSCYLWNGFARMVDS